MVEFEIDGKRVSAPEGAMIIEAADAAGIYIPRFCYHHKLSVVANCRMCLVEISTAHKALPACATPVTQDMKVFTQSEKALRAQRLVMEFLLINHPLDCPICDQGGECELQDLAMGFGNSHSCYDQPKRAVASEDIGPLIETEMTRCIHCTRCVRFGEEIAGLRELGVVFRGENSEIGTYVKHFVKSELSGNIIDLCPVGALTAKPSRYSERAWTLLEKPGIAPHDCVGSNIYINTRTQEYAPQQEVMRVNPRNNDAINECWISDRDRFSYEGLKHTDRIFKPRMKKNGHWIEVEWQYALMAVADRLQAIVQNQSPQQIAALVSPNSTVEDCFMMQKLMRALGSNNIDHRLRELDFSDQDSCPPFANLGIKIADVEKSDVILMIGSKVNAEQPLLGHRINKAFQAGATVMSISPIDDPMTFDVAHKMIDADIVSRLAEVAKALADDRGQSYKALALIQPSDTAKHIANALKAGQHSFVMMGNLAVQHPQAAMIRDLVRIIGELTDIIFGMVTEGANSSGAYLAGAVPHRGVAGEALSETGLTAKALLTTDPVRAYLLLNIEPEFDTAYPAQALKTLRDAGCVVCMTPFATKEMETYADFILPIAPFSETAGTFVNIEGTWQHFAAVSVPHGDAKPAWKVLRVLANFLQLDDFDYQTTHQIRKLVTNKIETMPEYQPVKSSLTKLAKTTSQLYRLAMPHGYRVDNLVRRASALQASIDAQARAVNVNSHTAQIFGVKDATKVLVTQGDQQKILPLVINESVADQVVMLAGALAETAGFGSAFSDIKLEPA